MQEQYDKAVTALRDLGFDTYPTFEQCTGPFTKKQLDYSKKHKGQLVITPPGDFWDLLERFDKGQTTKSYVYEELWKLYDLKQADWRVDFVLQDAQNDYDEPGLYGTNQTYEQQKKSLAKMKKDCAGLDSISPQTYILLQAIARPDYLDVSTWTRFIQYPKKAVEHDSFVGGVDSDDGQLYFYRGSGDAYPGGGLGVSVGQKISLSASPLPSSFSETAQSLQKLLEAEYARGAEDIKDKLRKFLDE